MATIDITVTDLTFPANLEDKYCRFRPLVSVRYKNSAGTTSYAREALPGLGPRDYWECEKGNRKKDDYVRHDTLPKVDTDKLDVSRREVIFSGLDVGSLERIEVELFDIDTKSGWEKVASTALNQALGGGALQLINPAMPLTLTLVKGAVEQQTGRNVEDLEKGLIDKLIGKEDGAARSIWVRSQDLTDPPPPTLTLTGPGKAGNFSMTLKLEVT